jgi:DinB superfamily
MTASKRFDMTAMLSVSEIQSILSATPAILRSLLSALSQDALHFRETPDSWTPFQVLCHVVDGEMTDWIPRLERILSDHPEKPFTPFDREVGFAVYGGWSLPALLDEFERLRALNLRRLRGIDGSDTMLERTGVHPAFGRVTLGQLLACWATHDAAHVAQISRSLTRYTGAHIGPWRAYFSVLAGDDRK